MGRAWKVLIAVEAALLAAFIAVVLTPTPPSEDLTPVLPSFAPPPRLELKALEVSPPARVEPSYESAVTEHDESLDMHSTSSFKKGRAVFDVIGGGGGGRYARDAGRPRRPQAQGPPREAPKDMTFKDAGVNPVLDTAVETQSTFALDVDTASYTFARAYLKGGGLPPKEAIRVEEFLNYFRYRDPKPPEGTFKVRLEAAPSPFAAGRHLLRVAVQARDVKAVDRKNVVLTFVVDVSGSMAREDRIGLVKSSLAFLVDRLRPEDRVGLVVYGSRGRKLLDPVPVSRKELIRAAIEALQVDGSTNLEQGLDLGYALAAEHFDAKAANRVVLCTDGVANNGVTDAEKLLKGVEGRAKKGVWLSVLGFGMGNVNDALMEELADRGNGNYAYIDGEAEARKVFTEKLTEMFEVVAADAKVQVEFDPATVAGFRLVGYENRVLENRDFRNDQVDAGELGAGHQVTALYELSLKPGARGRIATVRLRYREPDSREVLESQESLGRAQVLDDAAKASPSYRLAAAVAQFAELLRKSPHAPTIGFGSLHDAAHAAVEELGRPAEAVELLELLRLADKLSAP